MEKRTKHLEFIQGIVNRLSTNSFLLKGWSVVLISALFALSVPSSEASFIILAYVPAIILWGLDGYFLWQERLYRALYDHVRQLDESDIDFSMDTSPFQEGQALDQWLNAVFSKTLIPFYGVLIFSVIVVMILQIIY